MSAPKFVQTAIVMPEVRMMYAVVSKECQRSPKMES